MKLNKLVLVALLALGATACDKNDENDALTAGKKSVVLKIDGITSGSRSTGAASGETDKKITLSNVAIFFAGDDNIYKVETLENTETEKWEKLIGQEGVEYHNLPKDVNAVYIVGNVKEDLTKLGSVQTLKKQILDIEGEQAMDNITLFGEDKELKSVGASHSGEAHEEELTMYNAVVKLTPRVARIEIGNITCTDLGSEFSKLDLKVIGLLNFYESVQLDGTNPTLLITEDNVLEPTPDAVAEEGEYIFGKGDKTWGWDEFSASLDDTTPYNPIIDDEKQIEGKFVYNFIPNDDLKVRMYFNATTATGVPHSDNTLTAKFAPQNGFQAGYIYQVDLEFTEKDLKPWDPNAQICVNVSVTVKDWEITSLDPIYE